MPTLILESRTQEQIDDEEFTWIDDAQYMLTGVSLSMCIKSMCRDNIPASAIYEILSSTSYRTLEQFNQVMIIYAEYHWYKWPEQAIEICQQLKREGKITQNKLLNIPSPCGYQRDIWLEHGTLDYRCEYKEYIDEK